MGSSRPRNSTRLARRRPDLPDLHAILGRFARARTFFTVALRSLQADDRDECSQEAEVLEEALAALDAVYNELDAADMALCAVFKKLGVTGRQPRRAVRRDSKRSGKAWGGQLRRMPANRQIEGHRIAP